MAGIYDPSGAIYVTSSSADGRTGVYMPDGSLRVNLANAPTVLATELVPADDTIDVHPYLQDYFSSERANGRKLVIPRGRNWLINTATELVLPQYFDIEWEDGAVFDYTGDTAGSSRVRLRMEGNYGSVVLGSNPFSMVDTDATVTVTHTAHGKATGDIANFFGATAAGGLTIAGPYAITVLDVDTYTIEARANATSTTTGGGTAVSVYYAIGLVTGAVAAGDLTLTVGTGQGANFAERATYLLIATDNLAADNLTGNYTIEDTTPVPIGEHVMVKSISGDTLTLYAGIRFAQDNTNNPALFAIYDSPTGKLTNMQMLGSGTGTEKAISIDLGHNCLIEGGRIDNMVGPVIQLASSRKVVVRDMVGTMPTLTGIAAGFCAVNDGCEDILFDRIDTYGGAQVMMLSGSTSFHGIGTNIHFDRCNIRRAGVAAFSTHNQHENWSVRRSLIEDCAGDAIDNRVKDFTSDSNTFRRITGNAHLLRVVADKIRITNNKVETAERGVYLDETGSSVWTDRFEYVPGTITIQNNEFRGISTRGVSLSHPFLYSAAVPTLGEAIVENNLVELTSAAGTAIRVGGKWKYLSITNNKLTGGNGSAQAIQTDDATLGAGAGPLSAIVADNVFGTGYSNTINLSTSASTDMIRLNNRLLGTTIPGRNVASSTTLTATDYGGEFNNSGATALVIFTLPGAGSFTPGYVPTYKFFVQDADGIKLQLTSNDTVQIGNGAAGAANGSITSTTIGSWCRVTAIDSTKWIAEVNLAANWTVA